MSVGFASNTTKTKNNKARIQSIVLNSRLVKHGFPTVKDSVAEHRMMWKKEFKHKKRDYTIIELLSPKYSDFKCGYTKSGNYKLRKGLWALTIHPNTEFTIQVAVGTNLAYHADSIQWDIETTMGKDVYAQWKKIVMDDFNSIKFLIAKAQKKIKKPVTSITCSERSEKLCKKAGLPVEQGVAVLLPSK